MFKGRPKITAGDVRRDEVAVGEVTRVDRKGAAVRQPVKFVKAA